MSPNKANSELVPVHLPFAMPEVPATAAVNNAAKAIAGMPGHDLSTGRVIARASCEPQDLRKRRQSPNELDVEQGQLLVVQARVWTPALVPFFVNPRELHALRYGVELDPQKGHFPPLRPAAANPDVEASVRIHAHSVDHLVHSLEQSMEFLRRENDWSASIAENGVKKRTLLIPVEVTFDEGDSRTYLCPIDGSSRLTSCLRMLRMNPTRLLSEMTETRRLRAHLGRLRAPAEQQLVSPADRERLMALTMPAWIIVGLRRASGYEDASILDAVRSQLALEHVEPNKGWRDQPKALVKVDAGLEKLMLERKSFTTKKFEYNAGWMGIGEWKKNGYSPHVDMQFASAVHLFSGQSSAALEPIKAGIRSASNAPQIHRNVRMECGVAAGLRPQMAGPLAAAVGSAQAVLERAFNTKEIDDIAWSVRKVSPDELLGEAKDELKNGGPAEAAVEIAVKGSMYLALHGAFRRETAATKHPDTGERDQRAPSQIFKALHGSEHGLEVLAEALRAGRRGAPPLQVKPDGSPFVDADSGRQEAMTDDWLRFEVVPPGGRRGRTVPLNPQQEMREYLDRFEQQLTVADSRLLDAEQVELPTREPVINKEGIEIAFADELLGRLEDLRDRVSEHKFTAKRIHKRIELTNPERDDVNIEATS